MPGDGGTVALSAAEHQGGRLDWYSFDQGQVTAGTASAAQTDVRTVIPVPAEFPGMPKPRWWQFEDAAVDLGKLGADATDAARIVVSEFALLYGNNWFVLTCGQPVGTVAEVQGVIVTDVFGWRTLVEPAAHSAGANWTSWDAFSLSPRASGPATTPLPPTPLPPRGARSHRRRRTARVGGVRAGRDRRHGLGGRATGAGRAGRFPRRGGGGASAVHEFGAEDPPPAGVGTDAGTAPPTLRYRVQTDVAENWIPFIPVHKPQDTRAIRLQRAALERTAAAVAGRVRPVTSILRPGVSADDASATAYFVNEEEVSRAGVVVSGMFRRARRYDDGRRSCGERGG